MKREKHTVPLEEGDDLIDQLIEQSPDFRELLEKETPWENCLRRDCDTVSGSGRAPSGAAELERGKATRIGAGGFGHYGRQLRGQESAHNPLTGSRGTTPAEVSVERD